MSSMNLHEKHYDIYWDMIKKATSAAEVKDLKKKYPNINPKAALANEALKDRVEPDDEELANYLKTYHYDKIWTEVSSADIANSVFSMPIKLDDGREGIELTITPDKNSFEILLY